MPSEALQPPSHDATGWPDASQLESSSWGLNKALKAAATDQTMEIKRLQGALTALRNKPDTIDDQLLQQLWHYDTASISQLLALPILPSEPPCSAGLASGQPVPSVLEAAHLESHSEPKRKRHNDSSSGTRNSPEGEQQHQYHTADAIDLETIDQPDDLEMFGLRFLETEQNSSTRTNSGSGAGNENAAPIADYKPANLEMITNDDELRLEPCYSLETIDPPIDLEMFEVRFLETENNSSTGTGTGSGVGNDAAAPIADCEPAVAASISASNNSEVSSQEDTEEKTSFGSVVAALMSLNRDLISHWCPVVGTARFHLAMVMVGVLVTVACHWEALSVIKLAGTDQLVAPRITEHIKSNQIWKYELLPETADQLQLLLGLCCLLGAAWCWYLPICAKDWLQKLDLGRNTNNVIRRTWIRLYFCRVLPLIQMACAFQSYRDSGSIQTAILQPLSFTLLAVPLLLLQTDENVLRIHRSWLVIYGLLTVGCHWAAPVTLEDILWLKFVPWHLCSAFIYTSLTDHFQDSFFALAVVVAASPQEFNTMVGVTVASTVAICAKLLWCQLYLEDQPSIEDGFDHPKSVDP